MIIAGIYSHNGGVETIQGKYSAEYEEVKQIITLVKSENHRTKSLKYNSKVLNRAFRQEFEHRKWAGQQMRFDYPIDSYLGEHKVQTGKTAGYREIDFIKNRLGIDLHLINYPVGAYNACAKMTIFHNLGMIDVGVEIVPVKEFAKNMSTGVSYFEQFVWDLNQRGVADIDIPVMILGIAAK